MKQQNPRRLVVKVGTSTLTRETGSLNLQNMEKLARVLSDLEGMGYQVVLVSSGAIGIGTKKLRLEERPRELRMKQATAAVGQCMMVHIYDKLFAEYNRTVAQILLTGEDVESPIRSEHLRNTFEALLELGVIPVVNENDTVATYELELDNDTLSAIVASLVGADLLILLSDIDGLFTDDPRKNPEAKLIRRVEQLDDTVLHMAKESTGSDVGTGGMTTKLTAARIATRSGADMVIANGKDVGILHEIFEGDFVGTTFLAHKDEDFYMADFIEETL